MKENKISADSYIECIKDQYGEGVFQDAVAELRENSILFEGQYPFLSDATMRDRNVGEQKKMFEIFGFEDSAKIQSLSFDVKGHGWMFCFVVFGERFRSIEDVKKAVVSYFSK